MFANMQQTFWMEWMHVERNLIFLVYSFVSMFVADIICVHMLACTKWSVLESTPLKCMWCRDKDVDTQNAISYTRRLWLSQAHASDAWVLCTITHIYHTVHTSKYTNFWSDNMQYLKSKHNPSKRVNAKLWAEHVQVSSGDTHASIWHAFVVRFLSVIV